MIDVIIHAGIQCPVTHFQFMSSSSKSWWNMCCSYIENDYKIRSQFCKRHDSSSAKLLVQNCDPASGCHDICKIVKRLDSWKQNNDYWGYYSVDISFSWFIASSIFEYRCPVFKWIATTWLRSQRPISGRTYFRHICSLGVNFMQLLFFVLNRFLI